jgi:hypothetical protein
MSQHEPIKFLTELSAKLATRSRHICVFLGAGTSSACGLPDVDGLKGKVLDDLTGENRVAFLRQLEGRNLEEALSRLRRISALLGDNDTLDDLSRTAAIDLDKKVCEAIVKNLNIDSADLTAVYHLAAWIARAAYQLPVELFTPNYDLLLETALENLRVPYFDGFVGNLQARFHTELVEATRESEGECVPSFFVRLWKLHGSVNWQRLDSGEIVRLGHPVCGNSAAAIYPSDTKYEESRRVPFVVLHDRLRRSLQQPETLVIIAGYSFSDSHLNELIFDAATRRERSEFIVFCYADIPQNLCERATTTPNLQVVAGKEAILGGVRADWKAPEDPPPHLWQDGRVALGDFRNLAAHLARSTTRGTDSDAQLLALVKQAINREPEVEPRGG